MIKMIGSLCVIFATTAIGYQVSRELQRYLEELLSLKQLFSMMRGEIEYSRAPLGEIFGRIKKTMPEPYFSWLAELENRLEKRDGDSFFVIWERTLETCRRESRLKERDVERLLGMGINMGYLDAKTQLGAIELYLEQLQADIERTREGLAVKKRLCHCLGVMSGIFIAVILV